MRVELRNVGKRFHRVQALQAVDLVLPAGSRTALIGPNGSGKSTLTRMLMGMLGGTGEITLDGLSPQRHQAQLARRLAYVPQIAPRLAAPVRELVTAIARLRGIDRDRVTATASALHLDLEAVGRRPFRALSGGMRQKVLAALALAADADLLLLDEPTASLDPQSRAAFFQQVEALPGHRTMLLCSHRLEEIRRLVDRVVVLAEGRVAWHGPVGAYLAEHAAAMVEVSVAGDGAIDWLQARGFAPGAAGWWSRLLPLGERATVVREVMRELNGQVQDVIARDIDKLADDGRRSAVPGSPP